MILTKFAWNPGTGNTTFTPTYPPINKEPVNPLSAIRHDSISSDGTNHQVLIERIDQIQTLEFANVPQTDLATWATLMTFLIGGGIVAIHPDSTSGTNAEFICTDSTWTPKKAPGLKMFSFTINFRMLLPQTSGS